MHTTVTASELTAKTKYRLATALVHSLILMTIVQFGSPAMARDFVGELPLPLGPMLLHEQATLDSSGSPLDGPIAGAATGAPASPFHRILIPPQTDGTAQYFYDLKGNAACEVHLPGPASFADWFYPSSAILADINDDGKDDIILASHPYDPPARTDAGAVLVFFGRTGIFPDTLNPADADLKIYGRSDNDHFGTSVCAGDFNGDNKTDLLVGAFNVSNPNAVWTFGGGAMLFFGRTTWPAVWDLSVTADSADHEFYGMDAWNWYNRAGTAVAAGDVDGDGIDEAIIFSPSAPAPNGRDRVSNTWVYKGRSSWPSRVIELWSDLGAHTMAPGSFGALLYGADPKDAWIYLGGDPDLNNDFRINNITCDDINGDGKDDIMIAFWGADGPSNTGTERGEVRIIYGYSGLGTFNGSYPDTFNLADPSVPVIYGEDDYDRMSRVYAADLIGNDNIKDIIATSRQGAGWGNLKARSGEAYVVQGKPSLSSSYQMPGNADVVIYGAEAYDRLEYAAPFDGPYGGLLLGIGTGDGPNNQRTDCGEIKYINRDRFDQLTLPATIDLANFEVMTYAFGASANDWMTYAGQMAVGDVDGNGGLDILVPSPVMCLNPPTCNSTQGKATLINGTTFGNSDVDGDAVDGMCDNCYAAYNPLQEDTDADGFPEACDNCPGYANPGQEDADFDNIGDDCDFETTSWGQTSAIPSEAVSKHLVCDFNEDGIDDLVYDDNTTGIYVIFGPDWTQSSAKELVTTVHSVSGFRLAAHYSTPLSYYVIYGLTPDAYGFAYSVGLGACEYEFFYTRDFFGNWHWSFNTRNCPFSTELHGKTDVSIQNFASQWAVEGQLMGDVNPDQLISPHFLVEGMLNRTAKPPITLPFEFAAVTLIDANSDALDDIAFVYEDSLFVYLNSGNGAFAKSVGLRAGTPVSSVPPSIVAGDFDGDDNWDVCELIAYADSPFSALTIMYGNGLGGSKGTDRVIVNGTATSCSVGDANGDRLPDLIVSNSSLGRLEVFGRQKFGGFAGPLTINLGLGTGLPFLIATADMDRDGNLDFVTSTGALGGVTVSDNLGTAKPIVVDDMQVAAIDNASIKIQNPLGAVISSQYQSVVYARYSRQDINGNGNLDEITRDWNAMYGWYTITAKLRPNSPPGSTYSIAIGIDGSQQMIAAEKLTGGGNTMAATAATPNAAADSVVIHYLLEPTPTISPAFGSSVSTKRPLFNWTGRKNASANFYELQVDENLSFSSPRVSSPTLSFPAYQPTVDLGLDSVFYWRWREQIGGVWQAWSYPIPVKIVCCVGVTGNVDCDPTDGVDISDLSALIDYLYITFTPLCCKQEGNVDGSFDGNIDISDLSALIDYLYISFTPPASCQ